MTYTIRLRRSLAADWTAANPVLGEGEAGVESDTRYFKFGTGTLAWNELPYAIGPGDLMPDAVGLPDGKMLAIVDDEWVVVDAPSSGDPNAMLSTPAQLMYTYDTDEPIDPVDGDIWTDPDDDPPDTYADDLEAALIAGENIEINRIGNAFEIVSTAVGEVEPDLTGPNDLTFDTDVADGSTLPAGWSWLNQASGAAASAEQKYGSLFLYQPAGAFNYCKGIYRSIPAGFTKATARMGFDLASTGGPNDVGLFLQDSTTGRIICFTLRVDHVIYAIQFGSPTSYSSQSGVSYFGTPFDGIMQLKKNSPSSWDFSIGHRLGRLLPIFTAYNVSAWLANADRIGIYWTQEGGSKKLIYLDWMDFA